MINNNNTTILGSIEIPYMRISIEETKSGFARGIRVKDCWREEREIIADVSKDDLINLRVMIDKVIKGIKDIKCY